MAHISNKGTKNYVCFTFNNGVTLVVGWGKVHYTGEGGEYDLGGWRSYAERVEVTVLDEFRGSMTHEILPDLCSESDNVVGWLPVQDLPEIMLRVKNWRKQ